MHLIQNVRRERHGGEIAVQTYWTRLYPILLTTRVVTFWSHEAPAPCFPNLNSSRIILSCLIIACYCNVQQADFQSYLVCDTSAHQAQFPQSHYLLSFLVNNTPCCSLLPADGDPGSGVLSLLLGSKRCHGESPQQFKCCCQRSATAVIQNERGWKLLQHQTLGDPQSCWSSCFLDAGTLSAGTVTLT